MLTDKIALANYIKFRCNRRFLYGEKLGINEIELRLNSNLQTATILPDWVVNGTCIIGLKH